MGLRNAVAINLPLPSGSSPPEKPPGNAIICELSISAFIASIDFSISLEELFLTTNVFTFAPAFSKAFAVSYSQFVPGNTGINTVGVAMLCPLNVLLITKLSFSTSPLAFAVVGNTLSRVLVNAFSNSLTLIATLSEVIIALSFNSPIWVPLFVKMGAETTSIMSPIVGLNISGVIAFNLAPA